MSQELAAKYVFDHKFVVLGRNGPKWAKMGQNGPKWAKVGLKRVLEETTRDKWEKNFF